MSDMPAPAKNYIRWPAKVCLFLAAAVMIWLAATSDDWRTSFSFKGHPGDYYNHLVDGFLDGHLYMNLAVHPDRLSTDPEVRYHAPYALDASLYQGHYYLYYGVVPAVLVLLPYTAITGHHLSLNVPTLGFVLFGFAFSYAWYCQLRRHYFHAVGTTVDVGVVLLLAFGPATTFLVRRSMFYELPLAAGYAFCSLFLFALSRGLGETKRPGRWLALASLALGLAAGCHPNYALLTPLLILAIWWICHGGTSRPNWGRLLAAAIVPAVLIGTGLALYNYARFGNPIEFGFHYGENEFFSTKDRLMGADFIWPNVRWYYFTPPTLLPYFPFVFPANATFRPAGYHGIEAIHGQFLVTLAVGWVLAGSAFFLRKTALPRIVPRLLLLLTVTVLAQASFILILGIRANRYMVDFQFPLIAAVVVLIGCVGNAAPSGRMRRAWLGGLLCLTVLMSLGNLAAAIQQFDYFRNTRPRTFAAFSRILNVPWAVWDKLGLTKNGSLVLEVAFPPQKTSVIEPLITVGAPEYSDSVYALQHPNGYLEFLFDHKGYGGPRSRLLRYEPGRTYRIQIEMGGFLPPLGDSYYDRFEPSVVRNAKFRARLKLDDEVVIDQRMASYEAAPWDRQLGTNYVTFTAFSTRFSGRILSARWLPLEFPPLQTEPRCTLRLKAVFPDAAPGANQPLMASGVTGQGTLLFLQPVSPGRWKPCIDEWGGGLQTGNELAIPAGEHILDFLIGPVIDQDKTIANSADLQRFNRQLIMWVDGQLAAQFTLRINLASFNQLEIGANTLGFSTTPVGFFGNIETTPLTPAESSVILQRCASLP